MGILLSYTVPKAIKGDYRFKVYWGLKTAVRAMCVVSARNKS